MAPLCFGFKKIKLLQNNRFKKYVNANANFLDLPRNRLSSARTSKKNFQSRRTIFGANFGDCEVLAVYSTLHCSMYRIVLTNLHYFFIAYNFFLATGFLAKNTRKEVQYMTVWRTIKRSARIPLLASFNVTNCRRPNTKRVLPCKLVNFSCFYKRVANYALFFIDISATSFINLTQNFRWWRLSFRQLQVGKVRMFCWLAIAVFGSLLQKSTQYRFQLPVQRLRTTACPRMVATLTRCYDNTSNYYIHALWLFIGSSQMYITLLWLSWRHTTNLLKNSKVRSQHRGRGLNRVSKDLPRKTKRLARVLGSQQGTTTQTMDGRRQMDKWTWIKISGGIASNPQVSPSSWTQCISIF